MDFDSALAVTLSIVEVCAVGLGQYFRFNELFCPAHCRGGYFFCLDTKEAKSQDGKNLLPAGPAPGPVFRRAFARAKISLSF